MFNFQAKKKKKKKKFKQNQAHGKPNRANPSTNSQKKKKPIQNQISNLPIVPTVTSLQRIQRKPIPNILRYSIQIIIYRTKAKHTKSNILCLSKKKKKKNPNTEPLYQNGKTKPKPQYSLLGRRNLSMLSSP